MAGTLACLQRVDRGTSLAIGTDSKGVLDILERFRGQDSPPFLDGMLSSDLLGPMLDILHERMVRSAQTIQVIYKVRAHRGLALNQVADHQAERGHTSDVWIGESRGELLSNGLLFNKLSKDAKPLLSKADTNLRWMKAL